MQPNVCILLDVGTMAGLLELVDAVRARHVTPEIPVYYTVVAEP